MLVTSLPDLVGFGGTFTTSNEHLNGQTIQIDVDLVAGTLTHTIPAGIFTTGDVGSTFDLSFDFLYQLTGC